MWTRLVAVGLCAALAGWGVNQWLVWQLGQHTPPARAHQSAPASPAQDRTPPPFAEPTQPAVPQPIDDRSVRAVEPASEEPPGPDASPPERRPPTDHQAEPSRPTQPERRSPKSSDSERSVDKGPTQVFSVNDKKLAEQVDDLEELGAHGRVLPHIRDGERSGMRFVEVAPGGVFAQLGIRRGDVILSVNGEDLTTQQDALANFEDMRQMRTFDVILMRDGQRRHHRYVRNRSPDKPTD